MKPSHLLPLLTLLSCLVAGEPSSVERNAALQYWIAFAFLPDKEPAWLATMSPKQDGPIDPAAEQAESKPLRYLHLGADCAEGNFGSIVACESFGPGALLPHVGSARLLGRLALARATWRFEHGRSAEALADSYAVLAMAADLSNGGTLIEQLVALSIQQRAQNIIARYLPTCRPGERADLAAKLGAPRVRVHRDFARSESTMWRYFISRPEEMAQVAQQNASNAAENFPPAIPPELVAAVQAKDPQVEVWSREAATWMAGSVALIDLAADDFITERARLVSAPNPNPMLRTSLDMVLAVIEQERSLAVRNELLMAAAQALDQAGGLQTLTGRSTREGVATVTVQGAVVTVRVAGSNKAKPTEIIFGRNSPGNGF